MSDSESKVLPRERLISIVEGLRRSGRTIGVTNGTFDLIHPGHVKYLEDAKRYCDVLVVSVNTDSSVRRYKGEGRPIVSQDDRATVVAGLASVDYVTFHDEERMEATLRALAPDYYIKGGDYSRDGLTSADLVAEWSGKVVLGPLVPRQSTTGLIERIVDRNPPPIELPLKSGFSAGHRAVILDRDGVINEDVEYLHEPEKFRLLPHVPEGLKRLQELGYRLVIATGQTGIALGYYMKEDFFRVNREMLRALSEQDITVSKIYFCPHGIADGCECRKPQPGMIKQSAADLNLDLSECWVVGDKETDIEAGRRAGCRTILIRAAIMPAQSPTTNAHYVAANLLEAARLVEGAPPVIA